jgi:hypothetical protein
LSIHSGSTSKLHIRYYFGHLFMFLLTTSSKCLYLYSVTCGLICSFLNIEKSRLRDLTAVQMQYTEAAGITGHLMLVCMLLMYTTAQVQIRQNQNIPCSCILLLFSLTNTNVSCRRSDLCGWSCLPRISWKACNLSGLGFAGFHGSFALFCINPAEGELVSLQQCH